MPVTKLGHAFPHVFVGRSQQLEDVKELLELAVAGEESLFSCKLCEDASDTPHINSRSIVGCAEEDFRSSVPEGDNLVGVCLDGDRVVSTQAEVRDFYEWMVFGIIYQEILRLQIAMHNTKFVHMGCAFEELVHDAFDKGRIERVR